MTEHASLQLAHKRLFSASPWHPTAYILIIEERSCRTCRSVYSAPCRHPRVELQSTDGATRTISLQEFRTRLEAHELYAFEARACTGSSIYPTLERRLRRVKVEVETCPSCFTEHSHDQGLLPGFTIKGPRRLPPTELELLENIKQHQIALQSGDSHSFEEWLSAAQNGHRLTDNFRDKQKKKSKSLHPKEKKRPAFDLSYIINGR